MKLQAALQAALERLRASSVPDPKFTAEVLLAHALGRDRVYLIAHSKDDLDAATVSEFDRMIDARSSGVPTQYITAHQEFYGRDFAVSLRVLIPRPETEHLIEIALALAPEFFTPSQLAQPDRFHRECRHIRLPSPERERGVRANPKGEPRILDIGTGSGAIAVTLALELATHVDATDISADALEVARSNAASLGANCRFIQCDLGSAFDDASFDVVVSNPPYIASSTLPTLQREVRDHEPLLALDGGPDGLNIYLRLIPEAARLLRPKGWLILEIGSDQGVSVSALFDACWTDVRVTKDFAGLDRVVIARLR